MQTAVIYEERWSSVLHFTAVRNESSHVIPTTHSEQLQGSGVLQYRTAIRCAACFSDLERVMYGSTTVSMAMEHWTECSGMRTVGTEGLEIGRPCWRRHKSNRASKTSVECRQL